MLRRDHACGNGVREEAGDLLGSLYSNPEQGVGGEDGEQCLNFKSVLKAGSMGFPNGVAVGFERKI